MDDDGLGGSTVVGYECGQVVEDGFEVVDAGQVVMPVHGPVIGQPYGLRAWGLRFRYVAFTSRCVTCARLGYWVDWMVWTGDVNLLDLA